MIEKLPKCSGLWVNSEGREVFLSSDKNVWRVSEAGEKTLADPYLHNVLRDARVSRGSWQLVTVRPKFPEYPPTPKRCLVRLGDNTYAWKLTTQAFHHTGYGITEGYQYEVVDHEDNDPEAVLAIRGAVGS